MFQWLNNLRTSDLEAAYNERNEAWEEKASAIERTALSNAALKRERDHCDDLRKSRASLQLHYDTLTGVLTETRNAVKVAKSDKVRLRAANESLRDARSAASNIADRLRQELVVAKANTTRMEAVADNLQERIDAQNEELTNAAAFMRAKDTRQTTIDRLAQEKTGHIEEIRVCRELMKARDQDIAAMKNYVNELKMIISGNAKTLTGLEDRLTASNADAEIWKGEADELAQGKSDLVRSVIKLTGVLETLKGTINATLQ